MARWPRDAHRGSLWLPGLPPAPGRHWVSGGLGASRQVPSRNVLEGRNAIHCQPVSAHVQKPGCSIYLYLQVS